MSNGEITAAAADNGDDSPICRQQTVVDTVATTPINTAPFQLPVDWTVKKVLRSDGIRHDKYYYEPVTGKKFDSMRAVERHLTGTAVTPLTEAPKESSCFEKYYKRRVRKKVIPLIADERFFPGPDHKTPSKALKRVSDARSSGVRKSMMLGGKLMKLADGKLTVTYHSKVAASPFNLPDGWVVKKVPRRNTTKYKGFSYKVYFEPGTGRKFRSLVSVNRHLAKEAEEDKPLAEMFNIGSPAKTLDLKKTNCRKKATSSTFGSGTPPARVKWVLTDDDGGDSTFKPFIGESMVADHVVQLWADRFMILINGRNFTAPKF